MGIFNKKKKFTHSTMQYDQMKMLPIERNRIRYNNILSKLSKILRNCIFPPYIHKKDGIHMHTAAVFAL